MLVKTCRKVRVFLFHIKSNIKYALYLLWHITKKSMCTHSNKNDMEHKTIIQKLLDKSLNKNYLEIGVATGENFVGINAKYKVGVDPIQPSELVKQTLSKNCIYHETNSDDFFAKGDSSAKFDVIFVDGYHEYKQVYRDIINSLEHLVPNGVIVAHDCKPMDLVTALPPRLYKHIDPVIKILNRGAWTGDVWKAIVHLRSFHNDLCVFTLDCDCGCAIISKGEPESPLSFSQAEIEAMDFDDLCSDYSGLLNLKPAEYLDTFLIRNGN